MHFSLSFFQRSKVVSPNSSKAACASCRGPKVGRSCQALAGWQGDDVKGSCCCCLGGMFMNSRLSLRLWRRTNAAIRCHGGRSKQANSDTRQSKKICGSRPSVVRGAASLLTTDLFFDAVIATACLQCDASVEIISLTETSSDISDLAATESNVRTSQQSSSGPCAGPTRPRSIVRGSITRQNGRSKPKSSLHASARFKS